MTKLTKQQLALRTKWTTALRSGEYQQTQSRLRKDGAFCCLGVLCDVSGRGGWEGDIYRRDEHACVNFPPEPVQDAGGIASFYDELAQMNDAHLDDFATIADAIDLDTLMRQDGCL